MAQVPRGPDHIPCSWLAPLEAAIKTLPVFATAGEELPGKGEVPKFNCTSPSEFGWICCQNAAKVLPGYPESLNGAK